MKEWVKGEKRTPSEGKGGEGEEQEGAYERGKVKEWRVMRGEK